MDDDGRPLWFEGKGIYQLVVGTLYADVNAVIPPEKQIPFNLEAAVVFHHGTVRVFPRALGGATLDPLCVVDAKKVNIDYNRFVLEDSDDPNAILAGEDFLDNTANFFRDRDYDMPRVYRPFVVASKDAMATRFVQANLRPEISPSVFPETAPFPGLPWYKGPGVYRLTFSEKFLENYAGPETDTEIEYNRYAFVGEGNRPLYFERTVVMASRLVWMYLEQTKSGKLISEAVTDAEKTDKDASWFLFDPAPQINNTYVYPMKDWKHVLPLLPEKPQREIDLFCRSIKTNDVFIRYLHRRLRADLFRGDDTVSLTSTILRKQADRFRAGGEEMVGDKEAFRSSLPAGTVRIFDRYTSLRFHV